jgi:hypothetical protein
MFPFDDLRTDFTDPLLFREEMTLVGAQLSV